MKPLTSEQQRLADQNRGIAFQEAKRFYRGTRCREDVNDLNSVALVGLCYAAAGWSPQLGVRFATYAFRACRNELRSYLASAGLVHVPYYLSLQRKRDHRFQGYRSSARAVGSLSEHGSPTHEPSTESEPTESLWRQEVMAAIQSIPPQERSCVELWLEGLSEAATGKAMGIGRGVARRAKVRGFELLRKRFAREVA